MLKYYWNYYQIENLNYMTHVLQNKLTMLFNAQLV